MTIRTAFCAASVLALATATGAFADSHTTTLTIATVNNGDMVRMQGLTDDFVLERPARGMGRR